VLRAALSDAVDDDLIEVNPLAGYTYRKKAAPKDDDEIDPFDRDEQAAILAALDGQGPQPRAVRLLDRDAHVGAGGVGLGRH
jgi:hypothetical protein